MAAETFTERLARLVKQAKMTEAEIATILDVSPTQARRLLDGTTQTLKLRGALRLATRLGVSPWYLAGEPEPTQRVAGASGTESPDPARLAQIEARMKELEDSISLLVAQEATEHRPKRRRSGAQSA